ncbi:hypothetical protein, partial [Mesorhizobium sp. M1C.F.Ca.ET.204.01.1.1]|uniref:hypothetical protein n=1 Tax=Mesorhizobium sp. M1C.F.Ca.ET.204.01.1.1 TaxID=2563929 RepID=UPI001AED7479
PKLSATTLTLLGLLGLEELVGPERLLRLAGPRICRDIASDADMQAATAILSKAMQDIEDLPVIPARSRTS